jgi:uncharacterized damage-inducible protein DinB
MIPVPEFFRHYFEYVVWADLRQLDAAKKLPPAEVAKDRGFSFGSISKVLRHEIAAQSMWLDRFEGVKPVWFGEDPAWDLLEQITAHWPSVHERGRKYIASLTPDKLAGNLTVTTIRGQTYDVPLWEAVFHMCQHSYYHRSQIASMLKLAGGDPVNTDYSNWVTSREKT